MYADKDGKPALFNYVFSADVPTVPSIELSVGMLLQDQTPNRSLQQAINEFQKKRPDVHVQAIDYIEGTSAFTAADAIRTLNTELLAGKGPDLLLLDDMPIQSYIDKGVLADLSRWVKPMMESGEILSNVAGTYEKDGKIYAIPTRFYLPTLWGQKDAIAASGSLSGIANYAEANAGKHIFFSADPDILLEEFYLTCAPAWKKAEGQIDEAVFARFLTDIKRIADAAPDTPLWVYDADDIVYGYYDNALLYVGNGKAELLPRLLYGFKNVVDPGGVVWAINGLQMDDPFITGEGDDQIGKFFTLMPGQAEGVYSPKTIMGVNTNSPRQELARELIQYMLSSEVQGYDFYQGFPVNEYAIENFEEKVGESDLRGTYTIVADGMELELGWPSRDVFDAVTELFPSLKTPSTLDVDLLDVIREEAEPFFEGSMTAEEVAARVANRENIKALEMQ